MAVNLNVGEGIVQILAQKAQERMAQAQLKLREDEAKQQAKLQQDQLKQADERFKAESAHRTAMEQLAKAQFQIAKQERLDSIQRRASETGQLPSGSVNVGNPLLPAAFDMPVALPDGSIITPENPKTFATRKGELDLAAQEPLKKMIAQFTQQQIEAREKSDIEQAKIRAAEQERATLERTTREAAEMEFKKGENEANRNTQLAIAAIAAGGRSDSRDLMNELRRENASKLSVDQRKTLATTTELSKVVDDVIDLGYAVNSKGSNRGKRVFDSRFAKGPGGALANWAKRTYDDVTRNTSPEEAAFDAALGALTDKNIMATKGQAFTSTEEKRAFFANIDQLAKARDRDEALAILERIRKQADSNRANMLKLLSPTQLEFLDDEFKPKPRYRTDARTGKRVLVQ